MVVDYAGTNKKSILLHQKGSQRLRWELSDVFSSDITCKWLANPDFGANVSASILVKMMKLDNKLGYELGPTFHEP